MDKNAASHFLLYSPENKISALPPAMCDICRSFFLNCGTEHMAGGRALILQKRTLTENVYTTLGETCIYPEHSVYENCSNHIETCYSDAMESDEKKG